MELVSQGKTTKKLSCHILINYLTNFPLFSSKHLDFLDWSDHIRISKKYKSLDGTSKLISLKNSMNSCRWEATSKGTKRTQFNWDSLNRFYC